MFLLKDVTTNEFMKVSEMKDEIITGFMRSSLESLKNKKKLSDLEIKYFQVKLKFFCVLQLLTLHKKSKCLRS